MGKIRAAWRTHLAINTDDELRTILQPLRLRVGPTMDEVRDQLNLMLRQAGFVPVPEGVMSHPYDELTRKLLQAGRPASPVTRSRRLRDARGCGKGRLSRSQIPSASESVLSLGGQNNWRTKRIDMLCLLDLFNGRRTKSPELWQAEIMPRLEEFLHLHVRPGGHYHLHLHAHTSIAFATGYSLDTKCGAEVVPVQSTQRS